MYIVALSQVQACTVVGSDETLRQVRAQQSYLLPDGVEMQPVLARTKFPYQLSAGTLPPLNRILFQHFRRTLPEDSPSGKVLRLY